MDPDFVREFGVMAAFIGLYMVGSILLLRGHKTDLSAVNGGPTAGNAGPGVPQRLNRRRKAIARDAAQKGGRADLDGDVNEE